MKSPKYHLYFSVEEYRLLFNSLANSRIDYIVKVDIPIRWMNCL